MTLSSSDRPLGNLGAVLSQWKVKLGLGSSQDTIQAHLYGVI